MPRALQVKRVPHTAPACNWWYAARQAGSAVKLARALNLSESTISRYISGTQRAPRASLELLASYLHVPIQDVTHSAVRGRRQRS